LYNVLRFSAVILENGVKVSVTLLPILTCYTVEVIISLTLTAIILILLCDWNFFRTNGTINVLVLGVLDIEIYDLRPADLHYYYCYNLSLSLLTY